MHLLRWVDFLACEPFQIGFFLWATLALLVSRFGRNQKANPIEHEWTMACVIEVNIHVSYPACAIGRAQRNAAEVPGMRVAGHNALITDVGLEATQISLVSHVRPEMGGVATTPP